MKYQYKYCSNCGELFDKKSETLYLCPKCDFRIFINPKPSVGVLIFNKDGELLLLRRTYDPGKGMLGIPGGFINPGENLIEAIKRETTEEIGVQIQNLKYFGSYSGNYLYKDIDYTTLSTIFICYLESDINIKISDSESDEFNFVKLNEIDIKKIGTEDVKKAVIELVQSRLH